VNRSIGIQTRDLLVQVSDKTLVDHLSFTLPQGAFLAVMGPNGAGKSSLLKALSGEWPSTKGEIRIQDRALAEWNGTALAQLRAVLPQALEIPFTLTAEEVVLLGRVSASGAGYSKEDKEIARETLAMVSMSHSTSRYFPTLSGGEKQRVQTARILAQVWHTPPAQRIFLLDEPASSLDLRQQLDILGIFRKQADQGATVFSVLHDLNQASAFSDRILFLSKGKLVAEGSTHDMLQESLIESVFSVPVLVQKHARQTGSVIIPLP
jgi:iron complex transport system ATP-binding protein